MSHNIEMVNMSKRSGDDIKFSPITTNTELELGLQSKAIRMQVLMSILANIAILSSGMALGFPAITIESLTNVTDPMALTQNQISWFASINSIFCPVGAIICSLVLDWIGRKRTLIMISVIAMVSWSLMSIASTTDVNLMYIQLLISRALIGIAIGMCGAPAAVYSAEISHPQIRGRLAVLTSLAIAVGILLIYLFGYFYPTDWRFVSIISSIVCGIAILVLIPIPESHTWLASKGRLDESEKALRLFRGIPKGVEVVNKGYKAELEHLMNLRSNRKSQPKASLIQKFSRPEAYKPFLIMVGFFACQQGSGIFVMIVYAVRFAKATGVLMDPLLCTVFVGVMRVIAGFLVGFIMDKWGRRWPSIVSAVFMALSLSGLAVYMKYPNEAFSWIPVTCILTYIFTSTLGILTVPFAMLSEIFPQEVRGPAAGATICVGYIFVFAMLKTFMPFEEAYGIFGVIVFYATVSAITVIYCYVFLPETKGKTLNEISDMFRGKLNARKGNNEATRNLE